ncbi:MAG: peptidylprolyl isomerase [Clostridiales bacterium]|nr:peptidylprolyl isomerase [Clostridiales bacterium]
MRKKIIWIMTATLALSMAGCSKGKEASKDSSVMVEGTTTPAPEENIQNNASKVIVTINDQEVTFDEFRIYLQSQRDEIVETYGNDIWSMEIDDEGTTYEQKFKQSVLDQIINIKLVCSQAQELGITLSEDELLDVDEYTSQFLSNFSQEAIDYYSVNKDIIRNIYKDNVLYNKIYESLTLNVDTNVSDEEAKQSVFQYILVAKYGYDADGKRFEYTTEQLEDAKAKAEQLHEEALTVSNFKDFALANSDDDDEVELTVGKGDMKPELEKVAFALKKGEVSDVIDNEEGYFIFYCVDEVDQEATDAKKEEIISERQEKAFNEMYKTWETSKEVKINEDLYNSISLKDDIVQ